MTNRLNRYSASITQPKSQGASQAMLHAIGLRTEDLDKPQIGIASVWFERNPCNMHLNDLATEVRKSVQSENLVGLRFYTIGVSDGISMGTDGMRYSLVSRDTVEQDFALRRQLFLCEQGYSYAILDSDDISDNLAKKEASSER